MKSIRITLALFALIATASCEVSFQEERTDSTQAEEITVHVGINWIPPMKNSSMLDRLRAEASGIYTRWTYDTGDNEDTGRRLKLTSGDLPDIWAFYGPNGQAQTDFMNAKVAEPIEAYLNMPDRYPNLAKIPQIVKDYIRASDGHTYFIPTFIKLDEDGASNTVRVDDGFWSWGQNGIFVRSDILAGVGMKVADLGTLEGFEFFLAKAADYRDDQGRAYIPLTMGDNFKGWRSIGALFGVDSVYEASGFSPNGKDDFIATRDHPGYKRTWEWLSRMYAQGLLDREMLTHKNELFIQKIITGRAAAYIGSMSDLAENGWAKAKSFEEPSTRYIAIPFPKVPGVTKIGSIESSSSMPWVGAYLMKGKNIEASLRYLDWALGQHIITVKYGPPGDAPKHMWNWVDKQKTVWAFHEQYSEDMTSGEPARERKYGQQPWFLANTNIPDTDTSITVRQTLKYQLQKKNGLVLAATGVKREMHNYDAVPVLQDGIVEKFNSVLGEIEAEYRAQFLVSGGDDGFEGIWAQYRQELESKGRWSEYKLEWMSQYYEFKKKVNF